MPRALSYLLAGLVVGLVACSSERGERTVSAPPVAIAPAIATDLEERIEATGQLVAPQRAEIAAEVGGRITQLAIDEGGAAEAGAAVLEIDPERRELELISMRSGVVEAEAALKEQERATRRVRQLHQRNVAAKSDLDQAETQLELVAARLNAARARLGVAARALADASVRAPFAGLVAQRFVSVGEFVQPGTKLFELVSLDPLEVEFHLAEVDSSRVRIGQRVAVRVAPFPDEVFAATVSVISPVIETRTRTLRVKAVLENPEGRLRPGLFARADLGISRRTDVLMVPEESILQRSDGSVVFRLVGNNRVERRVVEIGVFRDGQVEVVRGLAAADRVVTRGHTSLIDGSTVVVRNLDGSLAAPDIASRPQPNSSID
ncbi:MAG: efflux RND transporter periplasmic adaptor subunit [Myxococcota bacterium]